MINQLRNGGWFGFKSNKGQRPHLNFLTSQAKENAPAISMAFDQLQLPDIRTAPHRPIAPFGARERTVGAPQALFATNTTPKRVRRGRAAPIGDWLNMIDHLVGFGPKGQIAGINIYLNKCHHIKDIAEYGKKKSWTRPVDYFRCEDKSVDYAFAKYVSLRLLGFHASRLRLVWLAGAGGAHHAVTAVQLSEQTFILDNCTNAIGTDEGFQGMTPFLSLNGAYFYIHWPPNSSDGAEAALTLMEKMYTHNQMSSH